MKDLYLVDGYNVIFCMSDQYPTHDLETGRKRLIDALQDFGAHNDIEIIIVFDGQGTSLKIREETLSEYFHILFTPARMTADSYIERESYKRRDEYRSIFVVTSDGPEQNQVLGHGSYRLAVADLERMLKQDKKRQHTFIKTNNLKNMRSEIGRNLPVDVQAKLERLRKK